MFIPFLIYGINEEEYYLQFGKYLPILVNGIYGLILLSKNNKLILTKTSILFFCFISTISLNLLFHRNLGQQSEVIIYIFLEFVVLLGFTSLFKNFPFSTADRYKTIVLFSCLIGLHIIVGFFTLFFQHQNIFGIRFKNMFLGVFYNPAIYTNYLLLFSPLLLPLSIFIRSNSSVRRMWSYFSILLLITIFFISFHNQIRTSIIAFLSLIGSYFLIFYIRSLYLKICSVLILLLVVICFLMSFPKQDSTNGRWLITKITWNMIKANPVIGVGFNMYKKEYSLYQKNYFSQNRSIKEKLIADDNQVAHNEPLQSVAELGLMSFIVFALIFYLARRQISIQNLTGFSSIIYISNLGFLVVLTILSILSHPFRMNETHSAVFTITLVFTLFSFRHTDKTILHIEKSFFIVLTGAILINESIDEYKLFKWMKHSQEYLKGHYQHFNFHQQSLFNNASYLYTTAVELNLLNRYKASNDHLILLKKLKNDSRIEILQGVNFSKMNNHAKAIEHFENSSKMNPKLLRPKYLIMNEFLAMSDTTNAKVYAKQILDMPVKILSEKTKQIKEEATTVISL